MLSYAVVQERFETIDPEVLQSVLLEQGGLTRPDASRVARHEHGILWEHFTREQAEHVCQALRGRGVSVRCVPADQLPVLERPRTIRWLEVGEDALTIPGPLEQTIRIDWNCVFVISSGQVGEIIDKLVPRKPSDQAYMRRATPLVHYEHHRESKRVSVTDLIAVSEENRYLHLRLPAHEMAYGRIFPTATAEVHSSFQKYVELVEQLVARSTSAVISPHTRELLETRREPPSHAGRTASWASLDDLAFERYNRWLLQLVVFREEGGS